MQRLEPEDPIPAMIQLIRSMKQVIERHESPPCDLTPQLNPFLTAQTLTVNAMEALIDYSPMRLKNDTQQYGALILAAIAVLNPQSQYHLEIPTLLRRQHLGLDYASVVASDPRFISGIAAMEKQVRTTCAEKGITYSDSQIQTAINQLIGSRRGELLGPS